MPIAKVSDRIRETSEQVDNFRRELDSWFIRFQNFYDRSNVQMRTYRLAHVDLVTSIYNQMMTVLGDQIEAIRVSANGLLDLVADRAVGEPSACLQGVLDDHTANSVRVNSNINVCAIYANISMQHMLSNVFYPAFAAIQTSISSVPVAVIDSLSRGNVLQDEEEIIEFLASRYAIIDMQWLTAVSQLLRWESNRFEVDGLFMVDQQTICMTESVFDYITANAALESRASAC